MFDWDAGSLHRLLLCIGFLALASLVFVFAFSHSISAELTCKLEEFDANSNASLQPVCDVCEQNGDCAVAFTVPLS